MMNKISRRVFLTRAGALVFAVMLPVDSRSEEGAKEMDKGGGNPVFPYRNAFIQIDPENKITFALPNIEMGQGIHTAAAMILMEELAVDWDYVTVKTAFSDSRESQAIIGEMKVTLGSGSVAKDWMPLRQAAAALRIMLLQAASQQFQIPFDQCKAEQGKVYGLDNQVATYGSLITRVATMTVPKETVFKKRNDYQFIGKSQSRIDTASKIMGQAIYGMDVRIDGMKTGLMVCSSIQGDRIAWLEDHKARQVKGVVDVLQLEEAACIIADHYWAASQAEKQLVLQWKSQQQNYCGLDTPSLYQRLQDGLQQASRILYHNHEFSVETALRQTRKRHKWVFQQPMQLHMALEPINCTVHFHDGQCEVWLGSQAPLDIRDQIAERMHLDKEKIILHYCDIGGSFGRRLSQDYILQAVSFAKQVKYPLQCVWSRAMDSVCDSVRAAYKDHIEAGVDAEGRIKTVRHRIIALENTGIKENAVQSDYLLGLSSMPYKIENYQLEYTGCMVPELAFGIGQGREATRNVFVLEHMINRLAFEAKTDPIEYRKGMQLEDRAIQTVNMVMQYAEWGKNLPKGVKQGFAMAHVFGSYIAMIVEAEITATLTIHLHRVIAVVDCGLAVNPDQVIAQIESGIVFGLGETLYGEVQIQQGQIMQRNYNQYRILHMNEVPKITIHLVESDEPPSGVGELGTVAVVPALTHALELARGSFFDRLPLAKQVFSN